MELSNDKLKVALAVYSTGKIGKKQLRSESLENRKKFIKRLENFFAENGWVFNMQSALLLAESFKIRVDGKKASGNSEATYIGLLRGFNKWCIDQDYLLKNFCQQIPKPPEAERMKAPVLNDIHPKILKKAFKLGTKPIKADTSLTRWKKKESFAALNFILETGLRSGGAVVHLKGNDIHTEAAEPFFIATLKGGKTKPFPIPKPFWKDMEERQQKGDKRAFEISQETLLIHLRKGLRALGYSGQIIDKAVVHTLRHVYVNERNRNGEPIQKIAQSIGDTVETVEKYYLHHSVDSLVKTVNNSRTISGGVPLDKTIEEIYESLKIRAREDSRCKMPLLSIQKDKIILEIPLTQLGIRELERPSNDRWRGGGIDG